MAGTLRFGAQEKGMKSWVVVRSVQGMGVSLSNH
jgi:hypothetical protein